MQNADYSWDDAFCLLRSAICVLPSLSRKTAHKKQTPLTPSRGREVLETPAVPPGFRPSTAELKSWKVGGWIQLFNFQLSNFSLDRRSLLRSYGGGPAQPTDVSRES